MVDAADANAAAAGRALNRREPKARSGEREEAEEAAEEGGDLRFRCEGDEEAGTDDDENDEGVRASPPPRALLLLRRLCTLLLRSRRAVARSRLPSRSRRRPIVSNGPRCFDRGLRPPRICTSCSVYRARTQPVRCVRARPETRVSSPGASVHPDKNPADHRPRPQSLGDFRQRQRRQLGRQACSTASHCTRRGRRRELQTWQPARPRGRAAGTRRPRLRRSPAAESCKFDNGLPGVRRARGRLSGRGTDMIIRWLVSERACRRNLVGIQMRGAGPAADEGDSDVTNSRMPEH